MQAARRAHQFRARRGGRARSARARRRYFDRNLPALSVLHRRRSAAHRRAREMRAAAAQRRANAMLSGCRAARRGRYHRVGPFALPAGDETARNFFEIWGGIAGVQWTLRCSHRQGARRWTTSRRSPRPMARGGSVSRTKARSRSDNMRISSSSICRRHTDVREEALFQRHRFTPYIGMKLRGVAAQTIRRGEVIYSDGAIAADSRWRARPRPGIRNATSGTYAQQLSARSSSANAGYVRARAAAGHAECHGDRACRSGAWARDSRNTRSSSKRMAVSQTGTDSELSSMCIEAIA